MSAQGPLFKTITTVSQRFQLIRLRGGSLVLCEGAGDLKLGNGEKDSIRVNRLGVSLPP